MNYLWMVMAYIAIFIALGGWGLVIMGLVSVMVMRVRGRNRQE